MKKQLRLLPSGAVGKQPSPFTNLHLALIHKKAVVALQQKGARLGGGRLTAALPKR